MFKERGAAETEQEGGGEGSILGMSGEKESRTGMPFLACAACVGWCPFLQVQGLGADPIPRGSFWLQSHREDSAAS